MVNSVEGQRWVGQGITQVDIDDKLSGTTRYVGDITVDGVLHGAIVRSPVAHGLIRHIDTSRAKNVPGVRAVVTANDRPRGFFGPHADDWEIFASDKVRSRGDEIAAVAANTIDAAQEAAALVAVDIDELPAIFDDWAALAPDAPILWDHSPDNVAFNFEIQRGDSAAGFAAADLIVEDDYASSPIYHAYLEPIGFIAQYHPGDNYTLTGPTHIPYIARTLYAKALGVRPDQIRIVVPPMGGSFGAKYVMLEPLIAAVLSRVTGQPVRIVYDREEDAAVARFRPGLSFHHKIGVTHDGRFVAKESDVLGVAGDRLFWSPEILATAVQRVDGLYDFQNVQGSGKLMYANTSGTTAMRGFGNAEALFGIEQMIDDLADKLSMSPIDLRARNVFREGDRTTHGWLISSSKLDTCMTRVDQASDFSQTRKQLATRRGTTGVRRGIGLAVGHHVSGYRPILKQYDGSSAIIRAGASGDVTLFVGEPDLGQAQPTILAQLTADTLGCRADRVTSQGIDSALSPDSVGTLASRGTAMAGMATIAAARDAHDRLNNFVAALWHVDPAAIHWANNAASTCDHSATFDELLSQYVTSNCGLPLLGQGAHKPKTDIPDQTKYGNPSASYPFAAHVAEVQVDCDTGNVEVLNYWAVHDSGTIINPSTARGQVVGAVAQGIGWALLEDVRVTDGVVRNPNFLDYRIPGAGDMPAVHVEFVNGYEPNGPAGAKSVAEVAIDPVTAAICNAIYNATGARIRRLPGAPEQIWDLLHDDAAANPRVESLPA